MGAVSVSVQPQHEEQVGARVSDLTPVTTSALFARSRPEPQRCRDCGARVDPVEESGWWVSPRFCDACVYAGSIATAWTSLGGKPTLEYPVPERIETDDAVKRLHTSVRNRAALEALIAAMESWRPSATGRKPGLYLQGPSGSGKTTAALTLAGEWEGYRYPLGHARPWEHPAVARLTKEIGSESAKRDVLARLRQRFGERAPWPRFRVAYLTASQFFAETRRLTMSRETTAELLIRELVAADLLILDGLGSETPSEAVREPLLRILDGRQRAGRSVVVTSHLPLEEIGRRLGKQGQDPYGQQVGRRLAEGCVEIRL